MIVDGIYTENSSAGSMTVGKNENWGRDEFLNLLIAQLKHQDPLNPMESTDFTAQLAQFSSLEQLDNINENLEYLQLYQASANNAQAVSFIGKSVTALGDSITVNDGSAEDIHFALEDDAKEVTVNIYDASGDLVKTFDSDSLKAGENQLNWDGTDQYGNIMTDGEYSFEVIAVNVDDAVVPVTTYTSGRITGITFKNNITYLVAGEKEIPIGSVIEITDS